MEDENIRLATIVQGFPELYKRDDPAFKDKNLKAIAWKKVSRTMNMSVPTCKVRWKSLRDRYCREKKRMDNPCIAPSQPSPSCRELINTLSFLDGFIKRRRTISGFYTSMPLGSHASGYMPCDTIIPHVTMADHIFIPPVECKLSPRDNSPDTLTFEPIAGGSGYYGNHSPSQDEMYAEVDAENKVKYESMGSQSEDGAERDSSADERKRKQKSRDKFATDVLEALKTATEELNRQHRSRANQDDVLLTADKLFVESLMTYLSKIPLRKRQEVKAEMLLLVSKYLDE